MRVHLSAGAHGVQKRNSDPLKLELQVIVSHLPWSWEPSMDVLEVHALNH